MHYCHLLGLYKIQIKTLLPGAQKCLKGFLVLQTGIHRGPFLLRWFKPSGLWIPCIGNREFKFEECACLAQQAEHMLIWKTEQETELNLAERAALLRKGKRLWRRLKSSTCWRNVHKLDVEHTLLSSVSPLFLSKIHESNKGNKTTSLPAQKAFGVWATDTWDWQPGGKQSQVYLQAVRCNSSQPSHGLPHGHIFSWWIFVYKLNPGSGWAWMWGRVLLSPACILLFPLSEAGTQQSVKRASEKTPTVSCYGWQGLTVTKIPAPRTSMIKFACEKR